MLILIFASVLKEAMWHSQARKWGGVLLFGRLLRCMPTCMVVSVALNTNSILLSHLRGLAGLDVPSFADRLWGNFYYDPSSRKFSRKAPSSDANRSFVHFKI